MAKTAQCDTFSELFMLYYERHVKLRNRCPRNAYYFFSVHGPHWKDVRLVDMTRVMIQSWAEGVAMKSPSAATRALGVMSAMFSWGIKREYFHGSNPCLGVERFKTKSRRRFLAPDELVRFCEALTEESPLIHDFFWICLTTAGRRGNVQSMRWDEIDFNLQTWTIPEEKFKNGETHVLPLNNVALAILKSRFERSSGSPWVFPTTKWSTTGHLMEPRRALIRILERAKIKDLHIHDLRRTLSSYMAIHGENQYVIAQMLGHKDLRSTAVYARLNMTAVRRASETVIDNWQALLSTNVEMVPQRLAQPVFTAKASGDEIFTELSACDQVLIEAKIITAIREGRATKKYFYRKIGSQVKFDKNDLNFVLAQMERRQLIARFQNDAGATYYALV